MRRMRRVNFSPIPRIQFPLARYWATPGFTHPWAIGLGMIEELLSSLASGPELTVQFFTATSWRFNCSFHSHKSCKVWAPRSWPLRWPFLPSATRQVLMMKHSQGFIVTGGFECNLHSFTRGFGGGLEGLAHDKIIDKYEDRGDIPAF